MLILRLILEEYGTYIEYIKGEKNIVPRALYWLYTNRNQETTQYSTYKKEIVSELNDTKELSEDIFRMNLRLIGYYQRK